MTRALPWLLPAVAVLPGAAAEGRPVADQAFTLSGGLRVSLQQDHDRPYLELGLEIRWQPGEEPAGREGSAALLARVLQAGSAGPYDPAALSRVLEERGIGFTFQAGPGRICWDLRCSSSQQEEAFALLAHMVARPSLGGTELEAQRAQMWQERLSLGLADWARLRFRWDLVEGRPEGLATERSLAEISGDTLAALHRRIVRPERALLRIRGDLNPAQARQLALLHLGVWGPAAEPPLPPAPKAKPRGARRPGCLAVPAGPPTATLALLPPPGPDPQLAAVLAELLPRWLQSRPAELAKAQGRVLRLEDGSPYLRLSASGAPGADPAALLLALRAWAEGLAGRTVSPAELDLAGRLRANRGAALSGSPAGVAAPATAPEAMALLQRWCAPGQQRALLTGAAEIAPDHPALKGLGPLEWVRSKE